jgi:hypothetical protein
VEYNTCEQSGFKIWNLETALWSWIDENQLGQESLLFLRGGKSNEKNRN